MASFSIKRRIVTSVVLTELFLVVAVLALASYFMYRHALHSFDAALYGRAMSVVALVRYSEGPRPDLVFDASLLPRPLDGNIPDLFRIETSDGHLIASSPNLAKPLDANRRGARSWEFSLDGTSYRALRLDDVPVLDTEEGDTPTTATLSVVYAAPTSGMRQSLARALLYVLAGSIVLLGTSLFISMWAIEKGLAPLSELASSAGSISASNWQLGPVSSAVNTVEIAPLTVAMSRMLDTLHTAFQQQRDFTANAAHELKTPVAILKSTLQSLLQQPRSTDAYREGINDALTDLARLEALLHSMLRLARAEQRGTGGTLRELSNVDVLATCESAIARLTPFAQSRAISISFVTPPEPILVRAEAEDLEIMWTNLIENAILYSPIRSEVRVTAVRHDGITRIAVEDNGPGFPPAEIPHVFDRFHRGDDSRSRESGGYGLGLAITKALVDAYGGSIAVTSPNGSGTCFAVELPVSS
jgi:signal transduction histidine kinase